MSTVVYFFHFPICLKFYQRANRKSEYFFNVQFARFLALLKFRCYFFYALVHLDRNASPWRQHHEGPLKVENGKFNEIYSRIGHTLHTRWKARGKARIAFGGRGIISGIFFRREFQFTSRSLGEGEFLIKNINFAICVPLLYIYCIKAVAKYDIPKLDQNTFRKKKTRHFDIT